MTNPEKAGAVAYVYKTVGGRELKLYVMRPADRTKDKPRAAIVFFHGGGWVVGAPGQFTEHCKHLVSRGMVTVQVQYRLLKRRGTEPPTICIQDAKSAMRWVRSHASELGIDPERIAAAGGSAGGHLAACVSLLPGQDDPGDDLTISPKANALILFNPVYNNAPAPEGWGNQRTGEHYRDFSPAHHIGKGAPPTLVFLGTRDKLIPVHTAREFQRQMLEAGARSELVLFEGKGHGFFNVGKDGGDAYRRTLEAMDDFLVSLGYLEKKSGDSDP